MWWLLGACAPTAPSGSFLGEYKEGTVQIAVAVNEGEVDVLFLGSGDQLHAETRSFAATAAADGTFGASADGFDLEGEIADTRVFGQIIDGAGVRVPWTTTSPPDPSIDGLWRPPEPVGACDAGVMVYNSGYQLAGAYCPDADTTVAVTPVDLTPQDGRVGVAAGEVEFEVVPMFPIEPE
ncbi:MAG: hypothetical protein ABMA64_43645 [Myxococcota bacterium]